MHFENVGREGFMYLEWVVRNYERPDLPDVMLFCQADPNYHGTTEAMVLEHIDCVRSSLTSRPRCATNETVGPQGTGGFSWVGPELLPFEEGMPWSASAGYGHGVPDYVFTHYFRGCPWADARFSPGGCFSVTKSAVRAMPRSWYESWVRMSDAPFDGQTLGSSNRPEVGFTLERSWPCVFDPANAFGDSDHGQMPGCPCLELCPDSAE